MTSDQSMKSLSAIGSYSNPPSLNLRGAPEDGRRCRERNRNQKRGTSRQITIITKGQEKDIEVNNGLSTVSFDIP